MSESTSEILLHNLLSVLQTSFSQKVNIDRDYHIRMGMVDELLSNDYTGIVSTIMEFMIKSGTIDFKFETQNPELKKELETWQNSVNRNLSIDIQRGLKTVTAQYLRERWKSSFIGLKYRWEKVGNLQLPTNIWLVNGSCIRVEGNDKVLGGYLYSIDGKKLESKNNENNENVIIRKPFNSWYDKYPDPYLVKKGTLYNSLMKKELLQKQGDILEAIIPLITMIKAGNDAMAAVDQLPQEQDLKDLVNQVKEIKEAYRRRLKSKGTIGGFAHDVDIQHLIPDISKFFHADNVKSFDKNILASMGMIDIQGFSKNREESILNPKMLVEEVKDAVSDLTLIYEDVILEIKERNKRVLRNIDIKVKPSTIKAFITDAMRILARSMYDRGVVSKQTMNEDFMELDFETEVQRRDLERKRNLEDRLFPPVIMNQDSNTQQDVKTEDPEKQKEQSPEKKKTEKDISAVCETCKFVFGVKRDLNIDDLVECPECRELTLAGDYYEAPYDKNTSLPKSVRNALPAKVQTIFRKAFNSAVEQGHTEEDAFKIAWTAVKNAGYKKDDKTNKWKKASKDLDSCKKCGIEFDYNSTNENGMDSIKCPGCKQNLSQKDINFKEQ